MHLVAAEPQAAAPGSVNPPMVPHQLGGAGKAQAGAEEDKVTLHNTETAPTPGAERL